MYCLFYKDHSSVYVQCAAANGAPYPAGAYHGLRVQEASRPKVSPQASLRPQFRVYPISIVLKFDK